MAVDEDVFCGSCENRIKSTDKVIKCEGFCKLTFHLGCKNVSSKEFEAMQQLKDLMKYMWETCVQKIAKITSHKISADDYFGLHYMVGTLLGLVKGAVNDNSQLNERVSKLENNIRLSSDNDNVPVNSRLCCENVNVTSQEETVVPPQQTERPKRVVGCVWCGGVCGLVVWLFCGGGVCGCCVGGVLVFFVFFGVVGWCVLGVVVSGNQLYIRKLGV
ncbi:hypothetical protein J6590_060797 [Homalodisca vitripennis]|nr:hypothetical protein J6590_060797 [Homalodisca vitripennis]